MPTRGRQKGFIEIFGPEGGRVEIETFTCGHCSAIVQVPPKAPPEKLGGMCGACMSMICGPCVATGKCDPIEEKLKRIEDRGRFLREAGLG